MFKKSSISGITLESAGLVALADLSTVAVRTALTGTASWIDVLVLAPGMHQQQSADEVNRGEFPQTGSLTSGYVFRVENPATVNYLQCIGRTGYLVTAQVEPKPVSRNPSKTPYFKNTYLYPQNHTLHCWLFRGSAISIMSDIDNRRLLTCGFHQGLVGTGGLGDACSV
ncbi:hypothetical protein ARMGADRAFT_448015 [Armillaria gallica]|uniref:Uncharacterized protein n=1 Tax=Armillaria gallica TaxID=47427 RepID=A0A2H3D9V1_ARMGA|nr:hypothetical protein ARMGADRAFT_448015 [Armillaria gallica]